ncbi:unnamed protein product [Dracunculus medinensis]|uniref:Complex I-13kD-B n=1 Tax=Dracunculus medinensis TaxID=318479 RepID=A0A0N4U3J2_DRAME|nr:unnamed protein product [Dracunculus medinensis]
MTSRMEMAARLGDGRKLFRLLHKATQRNDEGPHLVRCKKFFEAKLSHDVPSVISDIPEPLVEQYVYKLTAE